MKDAVVVLGMGGPDSVESIPIFLNNLFSDTDIINFHIGKYPQKLLAKMISSTRAVKVTPEYLKMGLGGASPQNVYTNKLLEKLPELYKSRTGHELDAYGAMCYYKPYIADTIKTIKEKNYSKVILLPLYPHYSSTTTGACYKKIIKAYDTYKPNFTQACMVSHWYKNEKYTNCLVTRIKAAAAKLNKSVSDCYILFSAHSIPMSVVKRGDVYPEQIQAHVETITGILGTSKWEISYQSKVGPVAWLGPSTKDMLRKLKIIHTDNIIVVPISFISDHIETLIEIDEELIPELKSAGVNIVRTESLNDADDFTDAIMDIICGGENE